MDYYHDVILREGEARPSGSTIMNNLCSGSLRLLRSLRMTGTITKVSTLLLISLPATAQNISVGLYDNINTLYLTANQNYKVIEDLTEKPLPKESISYERSRKMVDLALTGFGPNKLSSHQPKNWNKYLQTAPEAKEFTTTRTLLEKNANDKSLIRSSPAAANPLLIAAEPDLVTSSRLVKFECAPEAVTAQRYGFTETEQAIDNQSKTLPCLFKIKIPYQHSQIYRGSIIIKPFKDSFTVINNLDLEDYLKGVVPAEMPSSWSFEALKAQSVAARTYSMAMLGRRKALGYDLKSTVEDQMYLGYQKEDPVTTAAIKATQGELLINDQGLYVDAYFSSHGGSYTNTPEGAWGLNSAAYLIPVKEVQRSNLNAQWQIEFTKTQLEEKLKDLRFKSIDAITILSRSLEGRVANVLISGGVEHKSLTGEEFRHKLGLRSTNFDIYYSANSILITGSGYGHGIGMSQHGAKYLAEHGRTYEEILGYYYRGAKLLKL